MEESKESSSIVKITNRQFELSDLNRVYQIEKKSFPHPWSKLEFTWFHCNNPRGFLVTVRNGKIIGYIVAEVLACWKPRSVQSKKRGHLLSIAVDPKFRRQGIGKTLIETIIEYLRQENIENLVLEVRSSNFTAISFYKTMGFTERQRKTKYYLDEDAVVMVRDL